MFVQVNVLRHSPQGFASAVLGLLGEEEKWSPRVMSLSLIALRILSREQTGVEGAVSREGLSVITHLAGLSECGPPPISADRLEGECVYVYV